MLTAITASIVEIVINSTALRHHEVTIMAYCNAKMQLILKLRSSR